MQCYQKKKRSLRDDMESKSSKNQLVLAGCSMMADYVTHKNDVSNYGKLMQRRTDGKAVKWDVIEPWPTPDVIIAKEFGNDPVNIALPGASNERIFKHVCEYIFANHNKIDRLIVAWSSFSRIDVPLNHKNGFGDTFASIHVNSYDINDPNVKMRIGHQRLFDIWCALHRAGSIDPILEINNFFFWNKIIRDLCYMYDIKLYQCASIVDVNDNDKSVNETKIYKHIIEHRDYEEIEKTFYGWPIYLPIGGETLYTDWSEEFIISKDDNHPTEYAHQVVAGKLINWIKKKEYWIGKLK